MKKFLAIYHAPVESMGAMANATQEEQATVMNAWMSWKAANEDKIVDFGAPLMPSTIVGTGAATHTLSGYSVLQAESMEALIAACADHPHNADDGSYIQLQECVQM